jgi:hypothetical protein
MAMANCQAFSRPMARNCARQRLWRAMRLFSRIEGGFSISDLIVTSTCTYDTAARYLRPLVQAGYVRKIARHHTHRVASGGIGTGLPARYVLVLDSGPSAPRVRRHKSLRIVRAIFDPNTKCETEAGA